METISNIAVKDDLEISGNINGTAIIKNLSQSPLLLLIVDQFAFKKDTIGTLQSMLTIKQLTPTTPAFQ
jgi:hypothetical protein